jgi:cytochrome bd-type quinol oxidase subunit 2
MLRQQIAKLLILVISSLGLMFNFSTAFAFSCTDTDLTAQQAIQCGTQAASGNDTKTTQAAEDNINHTISSIINILSVVVGVIAVIMIIVGGFRYITSGGASEKVTSAKNTIMYAVIGLIIVALSQVIVQFVLDQSVNGASNSPTTSAPSGNNSGATGPHANQAH